MNYEDVNHSSSDALLAICSSSDTECAFAFGPAPVRSNQESKSSVFISDLASKH